MHGDTAVLSGPTSAPVGDITKNWKTSAKLEPARQTSRRTGHRNNNNVLFVVNDSGTDDLNIIRNHLDQKGIPDKENKVIGINDTSDLIKIGRFLHDEEISQVGFIVRNGNNQNVIQGIQSLLGFLEKQIYIKPIFLAADGSFDNFFTNPDIAKLKGLITSKLSGMFQVLSKYFHQPHAIFSAANNQASISSLLEQDSDDDLRQSCDDGIPRIREKGFFVTQIAGAAKPTMDISSKSRRLTSIIHQPARTVNLQDHKKSPDIEAFFPFVDKIFSLQQAE